MLHRYTAAPCAPQSESDLSLHQPAAGRETYFPQLDVLRFVLATAVVVEHAGFAMWEQVGTLAVQVFFALSGWLIGGILLQCEPRDLPRFFFNRITRIWIPYFLMLALLIALSLWRDHATIDQGWAKFIFYKLTFVYNLFGFSQYATSAAEMPLGGTGHLVWSIAAEEQFYLVAPLLIVLLPRALGRQPLFWLIVYAFVMWLSWFFFAAISLGVLAACVKQQAGAWHESGAARVLLWAAAALLLAAMVLGHTPYPVGQPLFSIAIVLAMAQPGARSAVKRFIGGMSYPLYLLHWIGLFAANALSARLGGRDSLAVQSVAVLLAWLVASAFYALVDRNIQRRRAQWFTVSRGRAAMAAAYALTSIGLIGALALQTLR
jgi:peptidoglycan/LPS O-acetylase OafA/YrhL